MKSGDKVNARLARRSCGYERRAFFAAIKRPLTTKAYRIMGGVIEMAQNIGFRPIYQLETAADFKLLNDEMRALWIKIMGGLTQKDMSGDAWQAVEDAYSTSLGVVDTRLKAIDQLNIDQNGRINTLEEFKADAETRIKTLEEFKAAADTRVKALETFKTEVEKRVKSVEDAQAATDTRVKAVEQAQAGAEKQIAALEEFKAEAEKRIQALNEFKAEADAKIVAGGIQSPGRGAHSGAGGGKRRETPDSAGGGIYPAASTVQQGTQTESKRERKEARVE